MKKSSIYYVIRAMISFAIFVLIAYLLVYQTKALDKVDDTIQNEIRLLLTPKLTTFLKGVTDVGNVATQSVIVLVISLFLISRKWYLDTVFLLFNTLISVISVLGFKNLFNRSRPDLFHLVTSHGSSFPSGHSMGAVLIIGSLVMIGHRRIKTTLVRRFIEGLLIFIIVLIGLSRIYLGVHYPSDVVGSFAFAYGVLNVTHLFYRERR